jgi:hypothetical protein
MTGIKPAFDILKCNKLGNGVDTVSFDIGRPAAFDRDDAAVEACEPIDLTRYGLFDQNLDTSGYLLSERAKVRLRL